MLISRTTTMSFCVRVGFFYKFASKKAKGGRQSSGGKGKGAGGDGEKNRMLRFAVVGDGFVGKSAVTLRFVRNLKVVDWDPTIEDFYVKTHNVDGKPYPLQLLDTAGQEDFRALMPEWMADKDGYVFVFDVTKARTLKYLDEYYRMHEMLNLRDPTKADPPIVLVGNKVDLVHSDPQVRQVSVDAAKELAEQWHAAYVETSALTGENVCEAFEALIRRVRKGGGWNGGSGVGDKRPWWKSCQLL